MILRSAIHMALHFFVPGAIAYAFWKDHWERAWLLMVSTMLVDMDHLLAVPIYDPSRCSIGFHPFHSYAAICVYMLLSLFSKTRILGVGLLIHISLDGIDCIWMGDQKLGF